MLYKKARRSYRHVSLYVHDAAFYIGSGANPKGVIVCILYEKGTRIVCM